MQHASDAVARCYSKHRRARALLDNHILVMESLEKSGETPALCHNGEWSPAIEPEYLPPSRAVVFEPKGKGHRRQCGVFRLRPVSKAGFLFGYSTTSSAKGDVVDGTRVDAYREAETH